MFLIFTSGLLGEQLSSVSFFICLEIDSPLIIFGEAIVLIGLEFWFPPDPYFMFLNFYFSLKNVVAIGSFS
tara:strand:+ start:187 stop:399 length:213 start_codon:yes stop_codon:yes gene_type:complete